MEYRPFRLVARIKEGKYALNWTRSKAGHEALVAIMAQDLEGTGVTANVLTPGGATATNMVIPPEGTSSRSLIQPEVMQSPVVWIASDAASNWTGRRIIAYHWDDTLPLESGWKSAALPPPGRNWVFRQSTRTGTARNEGPCSLAGSLPQDFTRNGFEAAPVMPIGIRRTPIWALLLGLVLLVACSPGETMTCRDGYEKLTSLQTRMIKTGGRLVRHAGRLAKCAYRGTNRRHRAASKYSGRASPSCLSQSAAPANVDSTLALV